MYIIDLLMLLSEIVHLLYGNYQYILGWQFSLNLTCCEVNSPVFCFLILEMKQYFHWKHSTKEHLTLLNLTIYIFFTWEENVEENLSVYLLASREGGSELVVAVGEESHKSSLSGFSFIPWLVWIQFYFSSGTFFLNLLGLPCVSRLVIGLIYCPSNHSILGNAIFSRRSCQSQHLIRMQSSVFSSIKTLWGIDISP